MRCILNATIGVMLDARARRAIDETLQDWAHESQLARGLPSRALCNAQAVLAISRTLGSIVLREVAELPKNGVWIRVGLWLLASFVLYQTVNGFQVPARASPAAKLVASFLLLPNWIVVFGPVALFLAATWQPRTDQPRTPFLGLAAFSIAAAFVLAGWVVPVANQEFRQVVFEMHGRHGLLTGGAAERTLPDLLLAYLSWPSLAVGLQLHARLALIAACPVLILLAAQMQPMRRRHRWVLAAFFLFLFRALVDEGVRLGALDRPVSIWMLPLTAFAAAAVIGSWRRARAQGSP